MHNKIAKGLAFILAIIILFIACLFNATLIVLLLSGITYLIGATLSNLTLLYVGAIIFGINYILSLFTLFYKLITQ